MRYERSDCVLVADGDRLAWDMKRGGSSGDSHEQRSGILKEDFHYEQITNLASIAQLHLKAFFFGPAADWTARVAAGGLNLTHAIELVVQ